MKKIIDWMTNVVGPKASAFARNPWIAAIQETMVATMPVMLISSFITIISIINEYVPNFPDFSFISTYTMGLSSIMVAILLPTFILEKLRLPKYKRQAGFMAVALLFAISQAGINDEGLFGIWSDRVNASGMFVAIVSGLFVAYIMKLFSKRSLFKKDTQMPKFLVDSFDSMAPIVVIMVVAYVLCYVLKLDVYNIISMLLSPLLTIAQSLFGITLTIVGYLIGLWLNRKFKTPILNPLLIAMVLIIPILYFCRIPYDSYNEGGSIITVFLVPVTTILGYSIYLQLETLKKYWLPILTGCLVSCGVSIGSTIALCKVFGLDETLTGSLVPHTVTTPIAVGVSEKLGGITGITVAGVIFTGVIGAVLAPLLVKLLRIKNPVGIGVGLGCSSTAIGTARAMELGEIQGAMSSMALGVAGMMTVVISLFL